MTNTPPPAGRHFTLAAGLLASMGVPAREPFTIHLPDDAFEPGRVVAFDAASFAGETPDGTLSAFAGRHRTPHDDLRRFVAPDVGSPAGGFVEYALYRSTDGDGTLDHPADDLRDFPTLRHPPHQLATQRVANRGIVLEVDEDAERLDGDWARRKVALLRGVLDRARLRRTIRLFAAGAVHVEKTWSAGAVDPDMDLIDELETQTLRASRVLYGPGAWTRRARAWQAQNTPAGDASAALSAEALAGELAVEEVRVVRTEGTIEVGGVAGNEVLLFCAADELGRHDFSNLKTFTGLTRTGQRYAVYRQRVGGRRWRIALECHETVAITGTAGLEVVTVG